jgi:hypothetical protein
LFVLSVGAEWSTSVSVAGTYSPMAPLAPTNQTRSPSSVTEAP